MTRCVICKAAVDGTSARFCSASCGAEADRVLARLARRQRRLSAHLMSPIKPYWRRWLPAVRRHQSALRTELADASAHAARLLAAKLAPEDIGPLTHDDTVGDQVSSSSAQTQAWRPSG